MAMDDKKNEEEYKPKNYSVKIVEGMAFTDSASAGAISAISGSIQQSYGTLAGTFSPHQTSIANSLHIDQNLDYLKKIAESMEKQVKLAEEQRDEAIRQRKESVDDAKRDRRNFNISMAVTVILGVVATILAVLALI